jgi:hypothetical protein
MPKRTADFARLRLIATPLANSKNPPASEWILNLGGAVGVLPPESKKPKRRILQAQL